MSLERLAVIFLVSSMVIIVLIAGVAVIWGIFEGYREIGWKVFVIVGAVVWPSAIVAAILYLSRHDRGMP